MTPDPQFILQKSKETSQTDLKLAPFNPDTQFLALKAHFYIYVYVPSVVFSFWSRLVWRCILSENEADP